MRQSSFTLLELLIILGIIAILAIIVLLIINPAELLRRARDTKRINDIQTLSGAIAFSQGIDFGLKLGSSSVVYVSLPDASSTCGSWGLPSLPSDWKYNCVGTSTLQKIDGSGWAPVNFQGMSTGSPLSNLPVDPVNSSSSGQYYSYVTNNEAWEVTDAFESQRFAPNAARDGGVKADVYEVGSNLSLYPFAEVPLSIAGLKLWLRSDRGVTKDGGGFISNWADQSGNGNDAAPLGASSSPLFIPANPIIINNHPRVQFDGVNDEDLGDLLMCNGVTSSFSDPNQPFTIFTVVAFVNLSDLGFQALWGFDNTAGPDSQLVTLYTKSGGVEDDTHFVYDDADNPYVGTTVDDGLGDSNFHLMETHGDMATYEILNNGVSKINETFAPAPGAVTLDEFVIGGDNQAGIIESRSNIHFAEMLIYNRNLNASEREQVRNYLNSKYAIY